MMVTNVKPQIQGNALTVFEKRYLHEGETVEDRLWSVARHIAQAERKWELNPVYQDSFVEFWATRFYERMARQEFFPNTPTLANAGAVRGTLSACFVIPIGDSWEEISEARRQAGWVHKFGGGTGFDFSKLRPEGSPIGTTQGSACGPVRVLEDFNQLPETLTQGNGALRKGANMGILRIDHPDVRRWIHAKDSGKNIANFNISLAVTDDFLRALEGNTPFEQEWVDGKGCCENDDEVGSCFCGWVTGSSIAYIFPLRFQGKTYEWIDARDLWQEICESAWKTGDPGLYFIDEAERHNPTPHIGKLDSTNPCGEVPLRAYEPCNLGSIAVNRFTHTNHFGVLDVDWNRLEECVRDAVRFLDNVVEVNEYPTPEIDKAARETRKIGLGVMGWHDLLIALKIPYDSVLAVQLAGDLMQFISDIADDESGNLAYVRGVYPAYRPENHEFPVRNATRTCIAPTGTIAIVADVSNGIEPYYDLYNDRTMEDGTVLREYIRGLAEWKADPANDGLYPPDYIKGAMDIDPYWHIAHQAAFQQNTDLAVSKTVNLRNDATVDDVSAAYLQAAYDRCKGVTIYRDGSREVQVLNSGTKKEAVNVGPASDNHGADFDRSHAEPVVSRDAGHERGYHRSLPNDVASVRRRFEFRESGLNGYIHAGFYEDGTIGEVFFNAAKSGSTVQGLLHALARTISTAVQYGTPLSEITRRLRGMQFEPAGMTASSDIRHASSIVDYIAQYLESIEHIPLRRIVDDERRTASPVVGFVVSTDPDTNESRVLLSGDTCPECGGVLRPTEACLTCRVCGYSRCG